MITNFQGLADTERYYLGLAKQANSAIVQLRNEGGGDPFGRANRPLNTEGFLTNQEPLVDRHNSLSGILGAAQLSHSARFTDMY